MTVGVAYAHVCVHICVIYTCVSTGAHKKNVRCPALSLLPYSLETGSLTEPGTSWQPASPSQ